MATSYLDQPPPPPPKRSDEYPDTTQPIMSSLGIPAKVFCSRLPPLTPMLGLDIPLSPVSPSSLSSVVDKTRKYSPLIDLIESEKAYVELLTGIIRVRSTSSPGSISCLIGRTTESRRCLVTIESSPARTRRYVSKCRRGIQDESHTLGSETFILLGLIPSFLILRRSLRRSVKIHPLPRFLVTC